MLPASVDSQWREKMSQFAEEGTESLYQAIETELEWLEVPYGNIVVLLPTIMHGNRINQEATTRWTFNYSF
ncbi:hypothetical protein CWATWH0401_253 [Crocosphaera watsonii WH 0401]|uniref:Uncharacterized protein n=1 Tax=Crocosphaera watsonii WH 0401 TaxID=555881 RepID=T2J331_CROWT|nr:hypothetical protein CWATWH0401_253 [Crocosphaera watsonii WH 0401]